MEVKRSDVSEYVMASKIVQLKTIKYSNSIIPTDLWVLREAGVQKPHLSTASQDCACIEG
jgi:hypothetical protein